jgi:hypothetical protein
MHYNKMMKLLKTGKNSDVSFDVGGTVFSAHKLILENNAPILAAYCERNNDGTVSIQETTPDVFRQVLENIYTGRLPTVVDVQKRVMELINASNKYELIDLKMAVENILVRERVMTKKNVADYLLFADAQSCPLLKEYAMAFFVLHSKEVLRSEHSERLRESGELLSEIIIQIGVGDDNGMSVAELRKELGKRELDVDGSKEALLSRWKEAKRQRME